MQVNSFIQNLKPYVAGRSIEEVQRQYGLKEIIKLASNENALGPNPRVVEALKNISNRIHMYPDAGYFESKQILSKKYSIQSEWISLGNGSNECIDTLIRIFCEPNQDRILLSEASFVAYKVCAHVNRIHVDEVALTDQFQIDISKIVSRFDNHKMVFIPNPNNPTGVYLSQKDLSPLMSLIEKNEQTLFVFDEAYSEFVRANDYPDSFTILKKFKNVILLRTAAKVFGLAGLRVGYLFAHPEIIQIIEKVRLPFNVSVMATEALRVALEDVDYIRRSQKMVWEGLDYFYNQLNSLGLPYVPSQGNFVFFDLQKDSTEIFEKLLSKGVILRPVKNYGFLTHMRMTVGTERENRLAIQALKEVL